MDITIKVSETTERKIRKQAAESGQEVERIVAGLVEEVWDEHFPQNTPAPVDAPHALFRMAGMFSSGKTDTSERMSELLYAENLDPAQGFGTDK